MSRLATSLIAASLAVTGAPVAVQAQSGGAYFTVELAAPASEQRVIAGGVVFNCEGTTCVGPRSRTRPLRVCSELRREVGTIVSFTADGEALPESRLARCNG